MINKSDCSSSNLSNDQFGFDFLHEKLIVDFIKTLRAFLNNRLKFLQLEFKLLGEKND